MVVVPETKSARGGGEFGTPWPPNRVGLFIMSKILESLPMTIVAGVVLTVIVAFLPGIMTSSPDLSDVKGQMGDLMK